MHGSATPQINRYAIHHHRYRRNCGLLSPLPVAEKRRIDMVACTCSSQPCPVCMVVDFASRCGRARLCRLWRCLRQCRHDLVMAGRCDSADHVGCGWFRRSPARYEHYYVWSTPNIASASCLWFRLSWKRFVDIVHENIALLVVESQAHSGYASGRFHGEAILWI